jgi:hypothetical protein
MHHTKPAHRFMCSEVVSIVHADLGAGPALRGNLEEIGERFAEVLTDRPFPRNSAVRIITKTCVLEGVVKDCYRDRVLGFFVQVALTADSRWSERSFIPQHLLKLDYGTPKVSALKAASGY